MINTKHIISPDVIWRFHVNPADHKLYLECKNELKQFYLWDTEHNKKWHFPTLEKYVCTIQHLQFPYAFLSYYHEENLMNQSIFMVYHLEKDTEEWMSSEIQVQQYLLNGLEVYHRKIEPRKIEYINFKREAIEHSETQELYIDVEHAIKEDNIHQISYNDYIAKLEISDKIELSIASQSKEIFSHSYEVEGINVQYDYLLRVHNQLIFLCDKHELYIFELKTNNLLDL